MLKDKLLKFQRAIESEGYTYVRATPASGKGVIDITVECPLPAAAAIDGAQPAPAINHAARLVSIAIDAGVSVADWRVYVACPQAVVLVGIDDVSAEAADDTAKPAAARSRAAK